MSTTSSTSMKGIRLISGSSLARGRKFISAAAKVVEVAGETLRRQLQRQQVFVDPGAEVAPEDQRRNGDDQPERRVVERHRDAVRQLRRIAPRRAAGGRL